MAPKSTQRWLAPAALLVVAIVALLGQRFEIFDVADVAPDVRGSTAEIQSGAFENPASDLEGIRLADLPAEALTTLRRIDDGDEHPFSQDDSIFQNRERLLPQRELGHYREYTVETPGERTRGARRIVAGADGERYYTSDHYDSFSEIIREVQATAPAG